MSICTLPQSCTKIVPIHCLCIVYPSPVQVQRLYQNINNRNPVLNLYPYPYLYSARTSTVPVHTKYIPIYNIYTCSCVPKYLCGVETPPTLKARFITLPSIRQNVSIQRTVSKTPPTPRMSKFTFLETYGNAIISQWLGGKGGLTTVLQPNKYPEIPLRMRKNSGSRLKNPQSDM
jgi:hypothetical protein